MTRRPVRRSDEFYAEARILFPPGGSSDGRPSFEEFEQGPLRGAETAFALGFEAQQAVVDGVGGLRVVTTPPTPVIGPLAIYACLTTDDVVELLSVVDDPDYWDMISTDPDG